MAVVYDDLDLASRLAAEVLADPATASQPAAGSVARRALGIARREAGDMAAGRRLLEEAVAVADAGGARREAALARLSLVGTLVWAGELVQARAVAARAEPDLDAVGQAALRSQLAVADEVMGRFGDALDAYELAEPVFVAHGETLWLERLRENRAVCLAQLGRLADAERQLDAAASGDQSGSRAAVLALNRAWIAALGADVRRALALYDEAAAAARAVPAPVGLVLRDRAELLASVGLWDEAVESATAAVDDLDGANPVAAAESRLVLATALAGAGRPAEAAEVASAAERGFEAQGRPTWAARASVLAASAAPDPSVAPSVERVLRAAATLAAAGLRADGLEARAVAVRLALRAGTGVPASALPLVPPLGPPWARGRAWLVEAERRLAAGDRGGAMRAAAAGLRPLEELRSSLGSVELRAGLAGVAADLSDLLVAGAAAGGRTGRLLAAAERRVGTVVRSDPTAGGELARALAALRAAAARAGATSEAADAAAALRSVAEAEAEVRRLARATAGRDRGRSRVDAATLAEHLGPDRVMARFVVTGGSVIVVLVDGRGTRRIDLGPVAPVVAAADRLRAGLHRQASLRVARAAGAVRAAAAEIDEALVARLRSRLGGRGLVIVPDGPLHGVAWGALPSLSGRPVATAPSAVAWMATTVATTRATDPAGSRAVFAAGPGLDAASGEVRAAAEAWRRSGATVEVLTGADATVGAVRAALAGATVAHLACHGRLRADAPPFSALELADGPLTGFDLDLLEAPTATVVLAACDVGAAVTSAGSAGEVLGFPGWLLGAGTSTVVASLVPVPDEAGARVFGALTASLAAGTAPAEALVHVAGVDPAVAAGLVCVGGG